MTTLEQLPPDQRAVLSLLLRQRKRYEEVATVLGISPEAVHDRAHAALAVLAPAKARLLDPDARDLIGDYLLGQQDDGEAAATKTYLAGSTPAREWARALAVELVKLAAEAVPEIPAAREQAAAVAAAQAPRDAAAGGQAATAGAQDASAEPRYAGAASREATSARHAPSTAPGSASPISRRGGAILLGAIVVIAAVVVVIALSSGGGSGSQAGTRSGEQASSTKSSAAEAGAKGSAKAKAKLEKAAALKAAQPGGSAEGAALIASEGSKRALYLTAKGLAATEGFSYVVWLLPKTGQPIAFGRTPSVTSKGTLQAAEVLTQEPSALSGVEITRETATQPSTPGTVVLKGNFVGS